LERRVGSWSRARGDLHVPAAVAELRDLAVLDRLADDLRGPHELAGVRTWYDHRSVPLTWPSRDGTPAVVWPRSALDRTMREAAAEAGVDVRLGTEAVTPIVERGFVRGAATRRVDLRRPSGGDGTDPRSAAIPDTDDEIRCRFLVIADGARSRFGRALGTHRDRRWPYAVTTAAYFESERHADTWADTVLAPHDPSGAPVTGHGWIHPLGDGRVSVGVNLLSSYRDVLGVNVVKLFDAFVASIADRWRLDPAARLTDPARVRTPLGGSVAPKMGPTFLVAGDAAGMANPFNGHGTGAALRTGRICAEVLDEALTVGNSTTLQRYPARLAEELGEYHKVGRLSARFLGRPTVLKVGLAVAMRSEAAMGAALRVSTNELRAGGEFERADRVSAGAERAYRLAAVAARFAPSW
ncbi:MAG: NAD(P)/FAD-dependent oxidoreductase, partial [Actinomycetota bacterium]